MSMVYGGAVDFSCLGEIKLLGRQVTQVVWVSHVQETLDNMVGFNFFSCQVDRHTNHLSLNYGNSRKL